MILQRFMLIFIIVFSLMMIGCDKVNTYDRSFVEDNITSLFLNNQKTMCEEKPESMFCVTDMNVGDIQPTSEYAEMTVKNFRPHTSYKVSDDWHYSDTIYEFDIRDCEDEAMTMIHHMVNDGIDKKYLFLVWQAWGNREAHIFIGVDTVEGMMHMDVNTGVKPIEENINWHMRMDNAGVDTWIKGNIK